MDFFDAHFHAAVCLDVCNSDNSLFPTWYYGVSCAHSPDEFALQEELCQKYPNILSAFGIHPQDPRTENLDFVEKLLQEGRICAIGECGFDLFTPEFAGMLDKQKIAFEGCLELALEYNVPIVFHNRKAWNLMFDYTAELKKLPSVLFHSFGFTHVEAIALLKKGINGYFSFGKQILNGNKKVLSCVRNLPEEVLLMETDAPFQTLKGESCTLPEEIQRVYQSALGERTFSRDFGMIMKENYARMFCCSDF